MKRKTVCGIMVGVFIVLGCVGFGHGAEQPYKGVVIKVLNQPRPIFDLLEEYIPEFEKETGMDIRIIYFSEADRRAKSRLDASTGAGGYQVYYMDEANVVEFATAGWILPVVDYYPAEYDFDDISDTWLRIASHEGIPYFVPTEGGGDLMFYRKDLLAAEGYAVPQTVDEFLEAIKHFHQPPMLYGNAPTGQRGGGINVWRWGPYLFAFGGKYLEGNEPVFNSSQAVEATKYYLQRIKYGPPGATTMSWQDTIENFRAGKVAFVIDVNIFRDWLEDPEKSRVVGKVGYAPPPAGPAGAFSAGWAHGLGIVAPGCKTEKVRKATGLFIAWATSKENEIRRIQNGILAVTRESALHSPEFEKAAGREYSEALGKMLPVTHITIMRVPEWAEISDNLGVLLEELFVGTKTDIKATLDQAVKYAKEVLARKK